MFSHHVYVCKSVTVALVLLYLISPPGRSNALRNEMRTTSECICPDFGVTYECTVMGTEDGFTVWRGSALHCIGNEITLRHRRFTSGEGAQGECNSGSVLGRSLRLEPGSLYVSQLSIRNSSEVVGGSIECVLFDSNVTDRLIGSAVVNTTTDSFQPPGEVSINFSELGSRRLTFSWSPVAPDCPAIHYNILASNCGSCPTTTNHTNITCTDVPIEHNAFCVCGIETVVCGDITGVLSNPISVSLSDKNVEREDIISGNINNGHDMPMTIYTNNAFIGTLVSAIVLAVTVVLTVAGFTIAILILIKRYKRENSKAILSKTELAKKYKLTVRYSGASNVEPGAAEDLENFDYEPEPISHRAASAVDSGPGEDNIETDYEPVTVPLDTNTNISYALHTR